MTEECVMLNVTLSRFVYPYNVGKGGDDETSEKSLW